jgi:hypothetical protein
MKIKKITITWDDGSITEHSAMTGLDLSSITSILSGAGSDISTAAPDSLLGLFKTTAQNFVTGGVGILTKIFGIDLGSLIGK